MYKFILFTLFVSSAFAEEANHQQQRNVYERCDKPKSNLYKKENSNDFLVMTLITNYEELNIHRNTDKLPSVLRIFEKGQISDIPVALQNRGNSRSSYCEAKPFRILFVSDSIKHKIEEQLLAENLLPTSDKYLTRYYEIFNQMGEQLQDSDYASSSHRLFKGLGDDIKFVTHCGKASENATIQVGGETVEAQNNYMFSEYYQYEMLALLNWSIEHVRLVQITYLNPQGQFIYNVEENGKSVHYRWGFFREPPKSVAQRCGLISKLPEGQNSGPYDPLSEFQATFANLFVLHPDYALGGHNMNHYYDDKYNTHFGPYDFDLSGIYDYNYSQPGTLEESSASYLMWLRQAPNSDYKIQALRNLLSKREEMRNILIHAFLPEERKIVMLKWFAYYIRALKDYQKELKQGQKAQEKAVQNELN